MDNDRGPQVTAVILMEVKPNAPWPTSAQPAAYMHGASFPLSCQQRRHEPCLLGCVLLQGIARVSVSSILTYFGDLAARR